MKINATLIAAALLLTGGCMQPPSTTVTAIRPRLTNPDTKLSPYGAYLERVVEAIQVEWDAILTKSTTYPPSGSSVIVRFILGSDGRIVRFVDVENHSTKRGADACIAAITNRAPYGSWTDEMKAKLNSDGEELVFTFYYQ